MIGMNYLSFTTNKRGKRILVHNGYRYTLNRIFNFKMYWECTLKRSRKQNCKSKVITTVDGALMKVRNFHNHSMSF